MTRNVGNLDRIIRLILILAIVLLYFLEIIEGNIAIVGFIVAIILLVTSVRRCCPLYSILKIGTCSVDEELKNDETRISTKNLEI